MILSCSACSTRFLVDSTLLGPEGRMVRCAKCGHQWMQIPSEEMAEDAAQDAGPPPLEAGPRAIPTGSDLPVFPRKPPRRSAAIGRVVLAAVVIGILGGGTIARDEIVAVWPLAVQLYELAGLEVATVPFGLELRNVKYSQRTEEGVPVLIVEGEVKNISRDRDVPETMLATIPEPDEFEVTAAVLAAIPESDESEVTVAVLASIPESDESEVTAAGGSMALETVKAETPAVTASAANRTTAMASPKPEPFPAAIETPAATAAPADRGTAAKPVQLATLAALLPKMEAKPKPGRFVVLGSYLKEANARDAMKRGHDFQPRMVRVRVHGKLFYRVVSGPYARSSIATMRRTLIGEGFRNAWTTTLCQNTLRRAPCRTTLAPLNVATNPPAS